MDIPLAWSKDEYLLSEFATRFTLPQLVKVERGYHGDDEDTALSGGQILTVHVIREADTVSAKDSRHRKVYIPKTCNQKVEVLMPGASSNYYETVAELSQPFPKFTRVTKEPESQKPHISFGDKLVLKRITKRKTCLECENQNGVRICLPMNLQAGFVPLYDGCEYSIHEVVTLFKMPVIVQFIDAQFGKDTKASTVFNSSLGVLNLQEVIKEESLVCSTKDDNLDKRYVVTIPRNMDITVVAARGAIVKDKEYASMCKALSDGVALSMLDTLESENVYASRQEIREYMQLSLFNVTSVYAKPSIPPKSLLRTSQKSGQALFTKSHGSRSKEVAGAKASNSVNDNIYESISQKHLPGAPDQPSTSSIQGIPEAKLISKDEDTEIENSKTYKNDESEADQTTEPRSRLLVTASPKATQNATDLSSLSVDGVTELLTKHRLSTFAETFRDEEIDGRMLLELDKASLRDLGLNNFQAKKCLMLIHGWQPKTDG